jgi:uncharacterized protein (DUF427 family)
MRAIWKGTTIAESDDIVEVEGNAYFPHDALRPEHFKPSDTHTTCPWKGRASYYDVVVGEDVNADAAWYYPSPKAGAEAVTGRVAFWRGVECGHERGTEVRRDRDRSRSGRSLSGRDTRCPGYEGGAHRGA